MLDLKERLKILCANALYRLGHQNDSRYVNRLKFELKHIGYQDEYGYLLGLYDKHVKFPVNENNLLVAYLLGLVDDFNINQPPKYVFTADFPDVDVDYLPEMQKWIKDIWAPQTFGSECVCNIGNYATYGIKSALQDMARVYGLSHEEVNNVTTQIEDRDEENKPISWEKALELNKELAAYCEKYPEVYMAARHLYGRVRGQGKHAGGLIISASRLDDFVPLTVDKQGNRLSSWTEGLHAQDLQPVGLVKFDVLVIVNLMQISRCLKLVRERHGVDRICAKPGQDDWSDTSYLNDEKAIELADKGQLKCVFQFDSPGIRDLVKKGGVTSFDDLVAYSALFRPGPMGSNLHITYCKRKRGLEKYDLHPVLQPILGNTYGVMCYQEQIMKIFNIVGGFPLPQCYQIVKAISKKKGEVFERAKAQFIVECQKKLEYSEDQARDFFAQIEKFAGYAFNKSHAVAYTYISSRLLYLKAHYPLEFFAAILSCERDQDKIKEYKSEAERFGIKLNAVDLNKSGVHFSIVDDTIYLGFADIKGIGDDAAQRIVENQPYTSFEDFLERFGTDASVLKPLIALRVFKDSDPITLYEFADYFREETKSRKERYKRYEFSQKKRIEDIRALVKENEEAVNAEWCEQFKEISKNDFLARYASLFLDGMADDAFKIINIFNRASEKYKEKISGNRSIVLSNFQPRGCIESEMRKMLSHHISIAENRYYGFPWRYIITQSPDYRGLTFDEFDVAAQSRDVVIMPVEVQVIEKPKKMKGKKVTYYRVKVMDGDGRVETITVWKEDFERFADEFNYWDDVGEWGNLLKVRLKRPSGDFKSYTLESPPKELRWKYIPKDKKDDVRCIPLRWPIKEQRDALDKMKEDFLGD